VEAHAQEEGTNANIRPTKPSSTQMLRNGRGFVQCISEQDGEGGAYRTENSVKLQEHNEENIVKGGVCL